MRVIFWNCCGGASGKMQSIKYIANKYNPTLIYIAEAEFERKMTWVHLQNYELSISEIWEI